MRLASLPPPLLVVALIACNAKIANVLETTPDGGGSSSSSSSSGGPCQSATGCEPDGPDCTVGQDQTCNASPQMSALAGRCVNGKCDCNPSFVKNFAGKCGAAPGPSTTTFPDFVPGLWLIGWSGGLDHFSWVRIQSDNGAQVGKTFYRSEPVERKGMTAYFNCDSQGTWNLAAMPNTIFLVFPEECRAKNPASLASALTFGTVSATPKFTKNALLQVNFVVQPDQPPLMGLKFPDDTCDLELKACADPLE